MNDLSIIDGFALTLADQAAAKKATRDKGGEGNIELIALSRTPLAKAEFTTGRPKFKFIEAAHLCRFVGTDYVQWFAREADDLFHPLGRIMLIVKVADNDRIAPFHTDNFFTKENG